MLFKIFITLCKNTSYSIVHKNHLKWLQIFTCTLIPSLCVAQEVIPDFYKEPGIVGNRESVNENFNEHIDPFSGALSLQYTDLSIPGNGGFDLEVVRSYNNTSVNPLNPFESEFYAGLGWTMHFGRVLKTKDAVVCANTIVSVAENPVLELQDGSKQLLAFPGTTSPLMLTTQRWKADCITTGGLAVYSPDGTRYDMTHFINIGTQANPIYAWYTTKITDKNGNNAVIAYKNASTSEMTSITANDGRSILFTYADSGLVTRRISSISGAGKTYTYGYNAISGVTGRYHLTSVTRPDNTSWGYAYNGDVNSVPIGSHMVKQVTYPQGGSINYAYQFVYFDSTSNPASRSTVVSSKTSSLGSWSFQYNPGGPNVLDLTRVNGPSGTTIYEHIGPNYTVSGTVWKVGLLISKTLGSQQTETYVWGKQKISSENFFRPGAFVTKVDPGETNAPIQTSVTITRNGASHVTQYSNHDSYGNPLTVTESGPNGGSRATTRTYNINTTKWIVKQPKNESFTGSSIVRSFDTNGNLSSENINGVTTSYTYDSQGNISSVTYPRGLVHSLSNYYRGIPRSETQPEGISISRIVSAAGNVTEETNGDGKITHYAYDGLDRPTSITYPAGNSQTINYTATSKTATRGSLVETTLYDSFGRKASVTLGGVKTSYNYDGLSRKIFESNPGSTIGTTYEYDILDRVKKITNSDGTFQTHSYTAATTSITDERGKTTVNKYRSYGNPSKQYLVSVTAPEASANLTISLNAIDLVTSVVQGGFTRSFTYNNNYYLETAVNPETGTTTYGRDAAGNMTSRSTGASGTTSFTYDNQNRLKTVSYPNGAPAITNNYNKTNKLVSATSSTGDRTLGYDANGNLTSETLTVDGLSFAAAYTYNARDQLSSITYPKSGRVVSYSPDSLGRPTSVSGYINNVSYWPSGLIKQIDYANGTVTSYGQNSRLWPGSFQTYKTGGASFINSSYSYDGVGNLTNINDVIDSTYSRALGYDNINRLTSVSGPWGSGVINYNGVGNITSQTLGSGLSYTYDSNNKLTGVSGSRTASYSYDASGNIISDSTKTYTYDGVPNLRCINCSNSATKIEYAYDATSQRSYSVKSGVKTYEMYGSNGSQLIEYTPGQPNKLVEYIYLGGKRIAQRISY